MKEHDGCVGCKYEHFTDTSSYCQGCKQNAIDKYTRKTNADRIRAMSDEELAEFLLGIDHYWDDGECIVVLDEKRIHDSKSDIVDWLQSEVEEEQ